MKATRSRQDAYADAMIQLTLGFESLHGRHLREKYGAQEKPADNGRDTPAAWVKVVTGIMDKAAATDPDQYRIQLRKLQRERGDIFVRRDKVWELLKPIVNSLSRQPGGEYESRH